MAPRHRARREQGLELAPDIGLRTVSDQRGVVHRQLLFLRWRIGGFSYSHGMPPSWSTSSPTFAHSSENSASYPDTIKIPR